MESIEEELLKLYGFKIFKDKPKNKFRYWKGRFHVNFEDGSLHAIFLNGKCVGDNINDLITVLSLIKLPNHQKYKLLNGIVKIKYLFSKLEDKNTEDLSKSESAFLYAHKLVSNDLYNLRK